MVLLKQPYESGFLPEAVPIRILFDMVEFPEAFAKGFLQELQRPLFLPRDGMEAGDRVIGPWQVRIELQGLLEGFKRLLIPSLAFRENECAWEQARFER
jgi:hypothetical protein